MLQGHCFLKFSYNACVCTKLDSVEVQGIVAVWWWKQSEEKKEGEGGEERGEREWMSMEEG